MKGTAVNLIFVDPAEGLKLIGDEFGDLARRAMKKKLDEIGGDDPHIVIASRLPHKTDNESTDHHEH